MVTLVQSAVPLIYGQSSIALRWTLLDGNITVPDQIGVYGTLNVPSSTSRPGARNAAAMTLDLQGQFFYVLGGSGMDGAGTKGK